MSRISQLQRLPQSTPEKFSGNEDDKTKFFLWESSFDALVESADLTPQHKLHLLYQYLTGKAKRVVEQLQYMVNKPDVAYKEARKILKDRFGNTALVSASFEKRLTNRPRIAHNDAAALQEFSDILRQVLIASKHINSLNVFNYPSKISPLVEKLPAWYKPKWSN